MWCGSPRERLFRSAASHPSFSGESFGAAAYSGSLTGLKHRPQRLGIRQAVIMAGFNQRFARHLAVPHQFLGVGERYHIVFAAMQDDRSGLDGAGRAELLPGGTEKNE